jgi:hypothetical protein
MTWAIWRQYRIQAAIAAAVPAACAAALVPASLGARTCPSSS